MKVLCLPYFCQPNFLASVIRRYFLSKKNDKANPPNCSGGLLLLANNRYKVYTVGAAAIISADTPLAYFSKFFMN